MSPSRKVAKKKVVAKKAAKKTAKKAVKKAAKKAAPVKKAAAAKKAAPAKKAAAAKKPAPAKKVAAAKKSPVKKTAPAKKPAPVKQTAPAKKTAPAKQPAAAKKPAPKHAPTGESVDAHIAAITDPGRRQDCRTLVEVFSNALGVQPKMWGPSVVAFGKYHYKYASGHEGDSCLAGFASRKGELTLYLTPEPMDRGELMRKLGKHREGKGCVYLKNLDGIDLEVLGELVKLSAETIRRKYPDES